MKDIWKQKKWKILICLIWGFLLKNQNTKKYYDRLSDWNQGMTNKREHRDSCNYVRVTWASDPRMRRERKKMWTTVIGPSPSHLELNAQQEKSKRRFSGWAALILTHGQVHFIYYTVSCVHTQTHTHAHIHTHTNTLSPSTWLYTHV